MVEVRVRVNYERAYELAELLEAVLRLPGVRRSAGNSGGASIM